MSDDLKVAVKVSVMTVDDQAAFRDIAREVIEATVGFEAVGEATCGDEALALMDELDPDLVLLDVRMPGLDGLETARRLSASHPHTTVVLLSSDRLEDSLRVERSGAAAFVRKQDLRPATLRRIWSEHGARLPGERR